MRQKSNSTPVTSEKLVRDDPTMASPRCLRARAAQIAKPREAGVKTAAHR
jgi:hypothetical protein